MNASGCARIAFADLMDYAAGDLPDADAAAFEEHLFACADCRARAAELDVLVRAIGPAVRSGQVGGFVTEGVATSNTARFIPSLTATIGFWSTLWLKMPDFTR